jgi:thymidylate kinase
MQVALIGVDGAGKSTISKKLMENFPVPIKTIYMGYNLESSEIVLPTTWVWLKFKSFTSKHENLGGPPDPSTRKPLTKNPIKRLFREIKIFVKSSIFISEEWFRQILAWCYQARGYLVLFDRHYFIDFYDYLILNKDKSLGLGHILHGKILQYIYPKPDLVIFLDAPIDILFARKGEGTIELLESRRNEYLAVKDQFKHFVIVDAQQSIADVLAEVQEILIAHIHNNENR